MHPDEYLANVIKDCLSIGIPRDVVFIMTRMGYDSMNAGEHGIVSLSTDEDALKSRRHIH